MGIEIASQALVDEFRSRPTVRAGSLITTVFGDSVAPCGGTLWLGSLIAVLQDLGISERLVRTSVFRLAKDGWLRAEQIGRRSYYSLTADGRERFRTATQRIYGKPGTEWDGDWCMLVLSGLDTGTRDLVRRECGWLGFGALTTNLMAHPVPNMADLASTLTRLGVKNTVVVLSGRTVASEDAMRQLAYESWDLADLDQRYKDFAEQFRWCLRALQQDPEIAPKTAFLIRTLLIQEYRKLMLRDPQMPAELLPDNWHGTEAYGVCQELYRRIYRQTDEYLASTVETAEGSLPSPNAEYFDRFGGLDIGS